jgi:hypothetical protein
MFTDHITNHFSSCSEIFDDQSHWYAVSVWHLRGCFHYSVSSTNVMSDPNDWCTVHTCRPNGVQVQGNWRAEGEVRQLLFPQMTQLFIA